MVNEIKYESRDMILETKCPAGFTQMVGSVMCRACKYNCSSNVKSRVVLCSWQKEEEDKMDLKSIAVRFENVEQREEIALVFKNNGFRITEGLDEYEYEYGSGTLGYIESGKYVSILTEYGRSDKKIISYEEFIGGKMKRLDIRKKYEDDKIRISLGYDYVGITLVSPKDVNCFDVKINLASECSTTITQVNKILKVMGLNYELYEGLDWNKVEEGANVLVLDKKGIIDGYRGKFVKYIADIKKIVVRDGDEVYIVDEDKVELCN